jgi:hypothetical protein
MNIVAFRLKKDRGIEFLESIYETPDAAVFIFIALLRIPSACGWF